MVKKKKKKKTKMGKKLALAKKTGLFDKVHIELFGGMSAASQGPSREKPGEEMLQDACNPGTIVIPLTNETLTC